MTTRETRTCTKCAQTKPLSEFYKQKSGAGGYKSRCKTCDNARTGDASVLRGARNLVHNRALALLADRHRDEFEQIKTEIAPSVHAEYQAKNQEGTS